MSYARKKEEKDLMKKGLKFFWVLILNWKPMRKELATKMGWTFEDIRKGWRDRI
jgi:hypothetical protein